MKRLYVLYKKRAVGYDEANDCPAYETTILAVIDNEQIVRNWLRRYASVYALVLPLNELPLVF